MHPVRHIHEMVVNQGAKHINICTATTTI